MYFVCIIYLTLIFGANYPIVSVETGANAPTYLKPRFLELLNETSSKGSILHLQIGMQSTPIISSSSGYIITVSSKSKVIQVQASSPLTLSYGAYDVLKRLGFGWLHPMHPFRPKNLTDSAIQLSSKDEVWEISPLLDFRGSHVHAEHPNELCDVLNGFGPRGKTDYESWESLLPEVDAYLEWLIANRQNAFEWSLLSAKYFKDFEQSDERLRRLARIVERAKSRHLDYVGIDATFSQTQEHGWRLWRKAHEKEEDDWNEIKGRIDWLLSAGFDGINSELGKSEMQHEDNTTRLLSLLNRTAAYLAERGKLYSLESHISTGQTIPNLPDPTNPSQPINFNWATYYLNHSIITRPHTVQIFSLTDPAHTYGAQNFSDSLKFIELMLNANRSVVYYPETNYWCNFDVSVPLFLAPVYSRSRLQDLSSIHNAAKNAPASLRGQVLFESSWMWGSWLQNIVAIQSQWIGNDLQHAFASVFAPLESSENVQLLAQELAALAELQHDLLIDGDGLKDLEKASGIAYLQGFDASADILQLLREHDIANLTTQPDRLSLAKLTMRKDFGHIPTLYFQIEPLLLRMEREFTNATSRLKLILKSFAGNDDQKRAILMDLIDSAEITRLRSIQIRASYQFAARCGFGNQSSICKNYEIESQNAIEAGLKIVHEQESRYGLFAVGSDRLWAWGDEVNPTAYGFGAHWPVHTLYYWRRDHAIAFEGKTHPCFANIRDPFDIYFGDGVSLSMEKIMEHVARILGSNDGIASCLAPKKEPWVDEFL